MTIKIHWSTGSSSDIYNYHVVLDCGHEVGIGNEQIGNYKWQEMWNKFRCNVCFSDVKIVQLTCQHTIQINQAALVNK